MPRAITRAVLRVELYETWQPVALITLVKRTPVPAAQLFAECARSVALGAAEARS